MLLFINLLQAAKPAAQAQPQGSPWTFWIMILAIFAILFFFTIRQQMRTKNSYMGNNIIASVIKFIAFLSLAIGVMVLIFCFYNQHENWISYAVAIGCIINCPIIWGFAYIVEAACKYLKKDKTVEVTNSRGKKEQQV